MRRFVQRLSRSGACQTAELGDAVTALHAQLRAGSSAAWLVQQCGAAADAGGSSAANGQQLPAPAAGPAAAAQQPAAQAGPTKPQPSAKQQPGKQQQQQHAAKTSKPARLPQQHQQQAGKGQGAKQQGGNTAAPAQSADSTYSGGGASHLLSGLSVAQLLEVPANAYFDVPAGILPEATQEYYKDPVLKGENVHEPNYGCRAVQAEWAFSGRRSLIARGCMHTLARTVQVRQEGGGGHIYLDGWAGSGKSVALYSLVAWARANGWLALYLPSAFSLVQGGTYTRGEDGLWDTPEAARWILSSLRDNHAAELAHIKTPSGQPVPDLIEEGLAAATKGPAAVAAAIAAKEAVAASRQLPTLIAVDDYNVLYSHTGYHEPVHNFYRRQLAPDELRLVHAFRVLEQPQPANGVAVAAPTFGQTISDKLRLPRPKGTRLGVPRYGLPEVAAAAHFFAEEVLGGSQGEPDEASLRRALFLTAGNALELREFAPGLLAEEPTLGLSRGYKAEAARRKAYDGGLI